MLAQLLILSAAGAGVIRSVWPNVAPNVARSAGLIAGPALFGAVTAFAMYMVPGTAGVAAGWAVVLAVAIGVIWRHGLPPKTLLPGWHFGVLWLVVFVIALAARQQYWIPDAMVHAPLSASLLAGTFPPQFPWTPDVPAIYHFLPELVIGALNVGLGPGLALTTEILGAFVAAALAVLVVAAAADLGASRLTMALVLPLLLSPGLWTLVLFVDRPAAVQMPIPVGVPEAGLRAALGSLYVPDIGSAATTPVAAAPPNIINPHFIWSHGLAMTLALLAIARARHRLTGVLVLALLISALSAIDETVFVAVLLALGGYAAVSVLRDRRHWRRQGPLLMALASGTGLAVVQGGVLTDLLLHALGGVDVANLRVPAPELAWIGGVRAIGGGLGALTVGVVAILILSAAAAYAAKSVSLAVIVVMALALFAGFALLRFPASPADIARLEGHCPEFGDDRHGDWACRRIGPTAPANRVTRRRPAPGRAGRVADDCGLDWPNRRGDRGRASRLYVAGTRPSEAAPSFSMRSRVDAEIAKQRQALLDAVSPRTYLRGERILTSHVTLVTAGTGQTGPSGLRPMAALPGAAWDLSTKMPCGFSTARHWTELGIDFVHVDAGHAQCHVRRGTAPPCLVVGIPPAVSGPGAAFRRALRRRFAAARVGPKRRHLQASVRWLSWPRAVGYSFRRPRTRSSACRCSTPSDRATVSLVEWGDPGHFRRDVNIRPPTGEAVDLIVLPDSLYPAPLDPAHRAPAWAMAMAYLVYDLMAPDPVGTFGTADPCRREFPARPVRDPDHLAARMARYLDRHGLGALSGSRAAHRHTGDTRARGAVVSGATRAPESRGQRITIRFDAARGQLEHRGALMALGAPWATPPARFQPAPMS